MGTLGNQNQDQLYISQNEIADLRDLPRVEAELQKGHIVLLKTESFFDLYQDDVVTLKKMVDQLRVIASRSGGGIARIDENVLVITPNEKIKIY
jgi:SepF-like predicted cell division protein (DUF552 family)